MASRTVIKKAINLPVTYTSLANGVPFAPLLNFSARASTLDAIEYAEHNHAHEVHGHRAAPRAPWAGGTVRSSSGLVSTTFINGTSVVETGSLSLVPLAGPENPSSNYDNYFLQLFLFIPPLA
jgi:hypothetical protein